jgi:hypothetical protein
MVQSDELWVKAAHAEWTGRSHWPSSSRQGPGVTNTSTGETKMSGSINLFLEHSETDIARYVDFK